MYWAQQIFVGWHMTTCLTLLAEVSIIFLLLYLIWQSSGMIALDKIHGALRHKGASIGDYLVQNNYKR